MGRFPEISLAQARKYRDEWRALLARGIDPQTHRAQEEERAKLRHLNSFQAVAERWRDKKMGEISEKTAQKNYRGLELHVLPKLGAYPVEEITPLLCVSALKSIEERGALYELSRLCGHINEVLNFAVNGGLIPFNPCLKIGATFKKPKTTNNPSIKSEELSELLQAMAKAKIEPQTLALFHFQLLTMVRPSEASKAEWREIDFDQSLWTIPAERMKQRKAHIVPLASQTLEILRRQHQITGERAHIFTKYGKPNEPMSSETVATALRRAGYGGRQTAHGLRKLARTWLGDNGVAYEHAEACLSHKTGSAVSQAYNHSTYLEQRKAIMQDWANFVARSAIVSTL